MRVKATTAGEAPAFDIWLMKQSAKLGGGALSQALWEAAIKVTGICQTEVAVIGPIKGFCSGVCQAPADAAGGFCAKPMVAVTSRATSNRDRFICAGPLPFQCNSEAGRWRERVLRYAAEAAPVGMTGKKKECGRL